MKFLLKTQEKRKISKKIFGRGALGGPGERGRGPPAAVGLPVDVQADVILNDF